MIKGIVVAAAFFVAIPAVAQTWTVEIAPPSDLVNPTVGTLSTNRIAYSTTEPGVQVSATVSIEKCKNKTWKDSHFAIVFANPTLAQMAYSNVQTLPIETETYSIFNDGVNPSPGPTYACRFPNASIEAKLPACVGEFMNGLHPRPDYLDSRLLIDFNNIDFTSMPVGSADAGFNPAKVQLAIRAKTDCSQPYAGAGLATEDPPTKIKDLSIPATITRTADKQWRIDVNQPIPTVQYGNWSYTVPNKGGRSWTYCRGYISAPTIWTNQMAFTITLTQQ